MRFIHTGDIHLGATPESKRDWAINRGDEIWNTFERLIKKIKNEQVDVLIISGDLFHRQPLLRELKEVDYLFSTIPNTRVVLCAGNHDAIKKGSFYKGFNWSENVIFLGEKNIQKVEVEELNTCFYGLSYYQSEITDAMYDHIVVDKPSMINILVAHGGEENHIPINKRKVAMSGFDYVALGHVHKPSIDEINRMAYCGSLEPIDTSDVGERGYIYGEITKDRFEVKLVPFAKRIYVEQDVEITPTATNMDLRHKLCGVVREKGQDNIYKITLTGHRNPDFELNIKDVETVGNIVLINDETVPDYDFEELCVENRDNILGMFIERFISKDNMSEMDNKTLYYGTKALLDAMEDRL